MGSLIFGVFLLVGMVVAFMFKLPGAVNKLKNTIASTVGVVGVVIGAMGGFSYNDGGNCQYIRTVTGHEDMACKTGWFFMGWGTSTQWPWEITVAHVPDITAGSGTSVNSPYKVRLSDNWSGTVTQVTRFRIPQDKDQFILMAKTYKSPEGAVSKALLPAVKSSLDSIANLFSMEEYFAGGQRDRFKSEYEDAISKGRAKVQRVTSYQTNEQHANGETGGATPNDLDSTQNTASSGDMRVQRSVMEKVVGPDGNVIRRSHSYAQFGITVSTAILENLDPDDRFEDQIQARKDAASRRIVAQEERKEQEEQRLLAIQRGATDIAKRQAEAQVEQIAATTDAETEKQLALIKASLTKEKADIAKKTATVNLDIAKIDAEAVIVTADADAHARKALLEADNALAMKLKTYEAVNAVWAEAFAERKVPNFVMGGTSGDGSGAPVGANDEFSTIMRLMGASAAKDLAVSIGVDTEVKK